MERTLGRLATALVAALVFSGCAFPSFLKRPPATDPDGDTNAYPTVTFRSSAGGGLENTSLAVVDVVRTGYPAIQVNVSYAFVGGTARGDGKGNASEPGFDYLFRDGLLEFMTSERSKTVAFVLVEDERDEVDETIVLELRSPENANLGRYSRFEYVVQDNDVARVEFASAAGGGKESTPTASIPVTLSTPSDLRVSVTYRVTGGDATGGGVDHNLGTGLLEFEPGERNRTLPFQVVDDALGEGNESLVVLLSEPRYGILGPNATFTFTIADDDPSPTVGFLNASSEGSEWATSARLDVGLSAPAGRPVSVVYAVSGGNASGAGVDYTLASGNLTFGPGETVRSINVTLVNDESAESNETLNVTLSAPVNATLGPNATHVFRFLDDDPPLVSFEAASNNVSEAIGNASVVLLLSRPSNATVTVAYNVTGGSALGNGTDYALSNGTATFGPGSNRAYVNFTVVDDALDESDETLLLALSAPVNAWLATPLDHTLTLRDNDP